MQVFVPFPSPIEVARCLDKKRLRKQIIECNQILSAIYGYSNAWSNHPIVKMYAEHTVWLWHYTEVLKYYQDGLPRLATYTSNAADFFRPSFLTDSLCDQHKRRLYTKSPELYPQFAEYGKSEENWYFVDGKIVKYSQGKKNNYPEKGN